MTSKRRGGITAAELMAQLANDAEYQRGMAEQEMARAERVQALETLEEPVLDDLHRAGIIVSDLYELIEVAPQRPDVAPIIFKHLESRAYPDTTLGALARALVRTWGHQHWDRIVGLYRTALGPLELQGFAASLARLAEPEDLDDLKALVNDKTLGESRGLLLSDIRRVGGKAGAAFVRGLVDDPLLGLEARTLSRRWSRNRG